jgi:hypothetical protein
MMTEILEPKTTTKVLIWEDISAINAFESNCQHMCNMLNAINDLWPFNSPADLPADVDEFILEKYLQSNKQARQMHQVKSLDIDECNLPNELESLRQYLHQWKQTRDKSAMEFITKGSLDFQVDSEKLAAYVDRTHRKYLSDPDHLAKLWFAESYIRWVQDNVDVTQRHHWANPMVLFRQLSLDKDSKFPLVNMSFVTG